ncbi:MAG: hypothetical protein H6739_03475 [Alphaproteobacteria bacterium]|nr:hypothetical protein [Alphaproteobacteria bacterium]
MAGSPYENADVRAECRETLVREMLLRTFAHDVRGAVMGVMGWVELASMDGEQLPAGLTRSLDRLETIVGRFDSVSTVSATEPVDVRPLLQHTLGLEVRGESEPALIPPLRFLAALELAAPEEIELSIDLRGGRSRQRIHLVGLPSAGVQLAMAPHYETLIERLGERDRVLGACLMRVVARSSGGELRGEPPDRLNLFFPLA